MPLFPVAEPGRCEFLVNNIYFLMTNGEHRIRCGVTDQALEALDFQMEPTLKGRLGAFGTHRAIIERIASAKFDSKKWERDGITILVRDIDVELK